MKRSYCLVAVLVLVSVLNASFSWATEAMSIYSFSGSSKINYTLFSDTEITKQAIKDEKEIEMLTTLVQAKKNAADTAKRTYMNDSIKTNETAYKKAVKKYKKAKEALDIAMAKQQFENEKEKAMLSIETYRTLVQAKKNAADTAKQTYMNDSTQTNETAYKKADTEYKKMKEVLDAAEKEISSDNGLKALKIGASVQFADGTTWSSAAPIIEATGNIFNSDHGGATFKIKIKPEPQTGTAEEVGQKIRTDLGDFTGNLDFVWKNYYKDPKDPDGPLGVQLSGGLGFGYQRANIETSTGTEDSDFGTASIDARLGVWLKYAYIGGKVAYNATFGTESDVSREVNETTTYSCVFITKLESIGDGTEDSKESAPFYLEIGYSGGKNKFNDGTFNLSITKSFNMN